MARIVRLLLPAHEVLSLTLDLLSHAAKRSEAHPHLAS